MARSLIAFAAAVSIGLSLGASAAEMTDHEKQLYEAAKENGEQVTWYVAHFNSETAEAVGKAFEEKYPGVSVNVVRTTAQVAYQRLMQDLQAGVSQCDVFSSTDVGHYVALKEEGQLMEYRPENAEKIYDAYKDIDPDNTYHVTSAGLVLITYNTKEVSEEEAPKNWTDLLDPKWKDKVSVGHPSYSGYVGTWVVAMRKLYGWDFFEKLEENNPQIGRSINDTVTMLNSGERTVAAGPAATTLRSAARGNPIAVIYPTDGTLLMIAPSGIPKVSENPNAAKLYMEFLMSPEAAQVQVENFSESVRPEVPPAPGGRPLSEVETIRPTIEEISEGIPEVKELWRDTFGV